MKKKVKVGNKTVEVEIDLLDQIMSPVEVGEMLRLQPSGVITALRQGTLKGYKRFNTWYILRSDVLAFIASA